MKDLPSYISDRGHGEICYEVPLSISGATVYAFALHARHEALQLLVDSQLNAAASPTVRYEAVGHSVLLIYFHAEHCSSTTETIGWLPDREAMVWVLVVQKTAQGSRLMFWIPYLLIDAMSGMVTGREVWGYRKSLAAIDLPIAATDPAQFVARTIVFKTFSPDTQGLVEPLITVSRNGPLGPLQTAWRDPEDVVKGAIAMLRESFSEFDMSDWLNAATVIEGLGKIAATLRIPVINLKQFRDVGDSAKACYQALVESPCELVALHGAGPLPGDFTASFLTCDSHRMVADLGLGTPAPGATSVPVRFAFWWKMDFTTLDGSVVWQAS
jgi:hypothetical protein